MARKTPSGQNIRRRVSRGHYVYRDVRERGKKAHRTQKQWKLSRRASQRQEHIRRAKKALEKAPPKPKVARKTRREEDDFEPVTVELNAITYEEGK
jgi:hypothetical protein